MTQDRRVRIGDESIRYALKRSNRRKKTVGIKIVHGAVEVAAPARTSVREIEEILRKRGGWILERIEAAAQLPPPRQLTTGELLPVMGRELPLSVEEANVRRSSAASNGEALVVRIPPGLEDEDRQEQVKAAVVGWYRKALAEYLQGSVARWMPVMGLTETPKVLVREQRSRWGSCSSDGSLRFSWRLAMVEPDLIDSVVVHELAHLEVMNHSPAFWEVMLKAMPDAKERRKRLNQAGYSLPL